MKRHLFLVVSLGAAAIAGCGSSGNSNPDSSVPPIDGSKNLDAALHDATTSGEAGAGTRIQDVQSDMMASGTPVTLTGKIVTAVDTYGAKTGNFWIEEPGGGPFSDVLVFGASNGATLAPGDVVSITGGEKFEFALSSDTSGNKDTEIEGVSAGSLVVTKTGTAAVPAPSVVDALAIGQMSGSAAINTAWRQWEGVLVTVKTTGGGVPVDGIPKAGSGSADPTLLNFTTTGELEVETELAALPGCAAAGSACTLVPQTCLTSITGVVDYFFNYIILPVTTADVVTGGTGCPLPETGATACTNGIDDDGNGFVDCADFSCEIGSGAFLGSACVGTTAAKCGCSVNEVVATGAAAVDAQYTTAATTAEVLNGEVVTAVGSNGFWIADALVAAAGHGAFVYLGAVPPATITIGATVTVQGLAELSGSGTVKVAELEDATVIGTPIAAVTAPTPLVLSAADLITATANPAAATGSAWAGTLVTLNGPFKVTTAANATNQIVLKNAAGTSITMDDGAFASYGGTIPMLNACFASITGVMDLFGTTRTVNPRSSADLVVGTCGF